MNFLSQSNVCLTNGKTNFQILAWALAISIASSAPAQTTTFTNQADFLAALPGAVVVENYDSFAAGTNIESGSLTNDLIYVYDFDSEMFQVNDVYNADSEPNSLGTTDLNLLQFGDEFDLLLPEPARAIGFSVIVAADDIDNGLIENDDVRISVEGEFAGLNVTAAQGLDLADGGRVFFIGLISETPFTIASVQYVANVFGIYNVDNLVYSAFFDGILLGDVNLDGIINLLDIAPFIEILSTGTYQVEADINQDGVINLLDIEGFVLLLAGG